MNTSYPLCAFENLQIEEAGNEVIVFDSKAQTFHLLNKTAYSILKACNGSNSIEDIATMLSQQFGTEDIDAVAADVTETIDSFESKGLLRPVDNAPAVSPNEPGQLSDSPLISVSVTGPSMFPLLLSGDKVLVKKCSLEELSIGDIVVWSEQPEKWVAHRIISWVRSSVPPLIVTKGDLYYQADPPIEFDRILGKVVAVLQDGEPKWIKDLENNYGSSADTKRSDEAGNGNQSRRRPSYKGLKVLDLREISVDAIQRIESVEEVSLVLLSPENAHVWPQVSAKNVGAVFTAPKEYRVYTGQPELLPEMLEFLDEPLRLIVCGQLFLTSFAPQKIREAFKELIVIGQVYVSSEEAKSALESMANITVGGISVVPAEHTRWLGESLLGPEYADHHTPLVAIGDLSISERLKEGSNGISLYR